MTTILPRRGTAAQWTAANPVLAMGEEGYETDTKRWKRGDGVTAWTALAYYQPSWNDITSKPAVIAAGADQAAARAAIGAGTASTKADVGLGLADNTPDIDKPVSTSVVSALAGKQPINAKLTTISGLPLANDDILQIKSGAIANRTLAQVLADLALEDIYPKVVIYAAGWPASRPDGVSIIVIGGPSAPTWLTTADLWFSDDADPMGIGYVQPFMPGVVMADQVWPAANDARYMRALSGGVITKVAIQVAVSAGNISIAIKNDNAGTPAIGVGSVKQSTGPIACPDIGYQEVELGASVTVAKGDWFCMSCDNTTASFRGFGGNDTDLHKNVAGRSGVSHPISNASTATTWSMSRLPAMRGVA